MSKKHCELLGYKISEGECTDTKNKDFHECQDCTEEAAKEEKMETEEGPREWVVCKDCGKRAKEDKWFSFSKGKCCVCVSRDARAAKRAKEGKEPVEYKPRGAKVKAAKAEKGADLSSDLPDFHKNQIIKHRLLSTTELMLEKEEQLGSVIPEPKPEEVIVPAAVKELTIKHGSFELSLRFG